MRFVLSSDGKIDAAFEEINRAGALSH